MKELTLLEQMILASIVALEDNAFGVSIRKKVESITTKRVMYGTLYNALDQLLRKGYVSRSKGSTSNARGGRPRLYYILTARGKEALKDSYLLNRSIWESIPDFFGE